MKVLDCPWEIENIGKKTVEISFLKDEKIDKASVIKAIQGYDYMVAKIPSANVSCLLGMQQLEFQVIECQLKISKKTKNFDYDSKLLKLLTKDFSCRVIDTEEGLLSVLSKMTSSMFTTDRVFLDEKLGPELGLNRYRNWISSEYKRGTVLFEYILNGTAVGFGLLRIDNQVMDGILGGIYEKFQGEGLGILTAASAFLYIKQFDIPVTIMHTAISSNNMPVMDMYDYLGFKVDDIQYVLVKHNN